MAKRRGPYGANAGRPPTKLQQFMAKQRVTQADIRRVTGLSPGTVSAAVQGKKTTPDTLIALSRGLKAPPVELTDDKRLIVHVAAQTAIDDGLDILAQTASAAIEKALRGRK